MIEVRMVLAPGELAAFGNFSAWIAEQREQRQKAEQAQAAATTDGTIVTPPPADTKTVDAEVVSIEGPSVAFVDDTTFFNAVRSFATTKGFAAASALLAEFGAKRAGDVAADRRAEFVRRTQES